MSVIICAHTQQNFSHRGIGMEMLVGTGWRDEIMASDYNKLSERQGVCHHFSIYFHSLQPTRQELCKSAWRLSRNRILKFLTRFH